MTDFLNTEQILEDLRTSIQTDADDLGFKRIFLNGSDVDFIYDNMPLLDLRIKAVEPQATTNATYYAIMTLEAEIMAYSFISREEAAKLRSTLTNALWRWVKDHPRFSAQLETTLIGRAEFGTGEDQKQGAFVAGTVMEFHPQRYTE